MMRMTTWVFLFIQLCIGTGFATPILSNRSFNLYETLRHTPVYNGVKVDVAELDIYEKLIANLGTDAQRWVAESGLFFEDGRISWLEGQVLKQVAKNKRPYQLWYLTSPRMMDGVGIWDAVFAWLWKYKRNPIDNLQDELKDIIDANYEELDISREVLGKFRSLVRRSAHDYQLRLGLAFIGNYGDARSDRFEYVTPAYNTQLAMLGSLLDCQWTSHVDRGLIASAIVYGSLFTAADMELKKYLPEYSAGIVRRLSTDGNSAAMLKRASIPALVQLVWGAPSAIYPSYQEKDEVKTDAWYPRLKRRPMTLKQFRWSFASLDLLDEIGLFAHEYDLDILKIHPTISFIADRAATSWVVQYKGRRFRGSHVMNPRYYWERFSQGLTTVGDDADRCAVEVLISRALGTPAVSGILVVDQGWIARDFTAVYDVSSDSFIAFWDDVEQRRRNRGFEQIQVAFQKAPWDNFRFDWNDMPAATRIINLGTEEARVLSTGLPASFLFRSINPKLSLAYEGVLTPEQQTQYNVEKGQ